MPHAEALVDLAGEHGLPLWLATGTFLLGWARWWAGDRETEAGMREGLALLRDVDFRIWVPHFGTLLAELEAEAGRVETGLATLDAQLGTIKETGERWFEAEMHRVRGELLLRREPPDVTGAEAALMGAIEIARSQKTRTFELRAALSLAKLYQTIGREQAARELLVPALVGFNAGPELPEVEDAQRLLTMHEHRMSYRK
jgi:predicted ATPase